MEYGMDEYGRHVTKDTRLETPNRKGGWTVQNERNRVGQKSSGGETMERELRVGERN